VWKKETASSYQLSVLSLQWRPGRKNGMKSGEEPRETEKKNEKNSKKVRPNFLKVLTEN
jgi:hypothetical protein